MGRRALVLLLAASLGLAACRVDATVTVRVHRDGSGTVQVRVRLDREAVQAAIVGGGTLPERVRLDDLRAAGWRTRWTVAKGTPPASAELVLAKRFPRARDAAAVVAELSGADGPLRDVRVTRDASTFRTRWTFGARADLGALRTGVVSDQELVSRLTAERVDVAALDAALLAQLRDAFHLTVVVSLPSDAARRWSVRPGTSAALHASTADTDTGRLVWLVVGGVAALLAVALVAIGEGRARRRRRDRVTVR